MGIICVIIFLLGISGALYCEIAGRGGWGLIGGYEVPYDLKNTYALWFLALACSPILIVWTQMIIYAFTKNKPKVSPMEIFEDAWGKMIGVLAALWVLCWLTVRFGPAAWAVLLLFGPMFWRAFRNPSKARKDAVNALKALGYKADEAKNLAMKAKGTTTEEIVKDAVRLDHLKPSLN